MGVTRVIVKPVRCDVEEPKEHTAKYGLLLGGGVLGNLRVLL